MPKSGQLWDPGVFGRSPLLTRFAELTAAFAGRSSWPSLSDFTDLAEAERRARAQELAPVRFLPAHPKRSRARRDTPLELGNLYEGRIALEGEVPCLDASYHDLFNAIAWAAFPRAKRAIHARQFAAIQRWVPPGASRLPNRRSREQDALTLFDEGGSVWVETESTDGTSTSKTAPVLGALKAGVEPVMFGHALMEHVVFGELPIRSAALRVRVPGSLTDARSLFDVIDHELARRLADPIEFCAPGTDGTLTFERDASVRLEISHPHAGSGFSG